MDGKYNCSKKCIYLLFPGLNKGIKGNNKNKGYLRKLRKNQGIFQSFSLSFFCSGVFVEMKETHRDFGILVFRVSSVSLYVSWFLRHSRFTQRFAISVENNASHGFTSIICIC